MRIQRSKSIQIQITMLISFGIVFSSGFLLILDLTRETNWKIILYTFAGTVVLLAIAWIICLVLIKCEKQYFLIENDKITLWRREEKLCELKKADMIDMCYVRFIWALTLQMGSGYLNITCPVETLTDKKFASIVLPNGIAVFEISMTKKQANAVSSILCKNVKIK